MEEARAFATYLEFVPHVEQRQNDMQKKIIEFAKQIPASARTVRLTHEKELIE